MAAPTPTIVNPAVPGPMDLIEDQLDRFGLMQGEAAPLKRGALGAALGAVVAYGLKPEWAWNGDEPRKFGFSHGETWFPVWAIVAAPAIILGVLI